MKKFLSCLLTAALLTVGLAACANPGRSSINSSAANNNDRKKISVVATTFPQYDWVRQVLGDQGERVELILLLDNGVDLHNYSPSVEHIAKIANCDLFLYVGGESDEWVTDALQTVNNPHRIAVNLLDLLGERVKQEELVEGMEHDHDHDGDHNDDHDHEEDGEPDEHVWLSLKNAQVVCSHLAQELGKLDGDNAAAYSANADAYIATLAALDARYQGLADRAENKTLLFGDRFPFRYLADDYGLGYYAAFAGCSAETEASFETVAFLAGKINDLNLDHIMVIESSDQSLANTIIQTTTGKNQDILVLDSMQSVTAKDVASGTTYLSIMESNLEVLTTALS